MIRYFRRKFFCSKNKHRMKFINDISSTEYLLRCVDCRKEVVKQIPSFDVHDIKALLQAAIEITKRKNK